MRKVYCPECDEVIRVGDGERVARCPACRARIDRDEPGDREERRPRKRRNKSPGGYGGLLALALLTPICLALMVWAVFDVRAAFAAAMGGLVASAGATLGMYFTLQRAGRDDMIDEPRFADQFRLSLQHPRAFGTWFVLECLCGVLALEGFALVFLHEKVWKKPAENPAQTAPAVPGSQPNPSKGSEPSVEDQAITKAIAELDNPNEFWRQATAGKLAEMTPKPDRREEVTKKLATRVTDDHQLTRLQSLKALGVWGGPEDVPTLVAALDHPDKDTRAAAATAVRRFRDPRAVPGLVKCLADVPFGKEAAKSLIEIGPSVEKALLPVLADPNSPALAQAVEVVKVVGTPDSLPALRRLANDPMKAHMADLVRDAMRRINMRAKK